MKNLNLVIRRTHLYLGMLLIPWVFVYAASTLLFNHGPWVRPLRGGPSDWTTLWEKEYRVDLPQGQPELRALGARLLDEHGGSSGAPYGVRRDGATFTVNAQRFLAPIRLVYHADSHRLVAERRAFNWVELITRLHVRAGYGPSGWLHKAWAVMVDVVCAAILLWIGTGLYLWWKIPGTRAWGWLAIAAGFGSFLSLLLAL